MAKGRGAVYYLQHSDVVDSRAPIGNISHCAQRARACANRPRVGMNNRMAARANRNIPIDPDEL
jgi:hypothetical protein